MSPSTNNTAHVVLTNVIPNVLTVQSSWLYPAEHMPDIPLLVGEVLSLYRRASRCQQRKSNCQQYCKRDLDHGLCGVLHCHLPLVSPTANRLEDTRPRFGTRTALQRSQRQGITRCVALKEVQPCLVEDSTARSYRCFRLLGLAGSSAESKVRILRDADGWHWGNIAQECRGRNRSHECALFEALQARAKLDCGGSSERRRQRRIRKGIPQ